jgi:hypothetical protein
MLGERGDMLFVNNLAILHARDSYKDSHAGEGPKRRIMCLMLHDDATSWELNDRVMNYHVRDMFEYLPTEQLLSLCPSGQQRQEILGIASLSMQRNTARCQFSIVVGFASGLDDTYLPDFFKAE